MDWIASLNLAWVSCFSGGKGEEKNLNVAPQFLSTWFSITQYLSLFSNSLSPTHPTSPPPSITTNSTITKRQFCREVTKKIESAWVQKTWTFNLNFSDYCTREASPPPRIKKYVKKIGGSLFSSFGSLWALYFQDTQVCVAGFDIIIPR